MTLKPGMPYPLPDHSLCVFVTFVEWVLANKNSHTTVGLMDEDIASHTSNPEPSPHSAQN